MSCLAMTLMYQVPINFRDTEGAISNVQPRDTDDIGYTRYQLHCEWNDNEGHILEVIA
jgi:hypothetical protein